MLAFGKALTAIRNRVEADLRLPGLPREKVVAAVVKLLESSGERREEQCVMQMVTTYVKKLRNNPPAPNTTRIPSANPSANVPE